MPADEGTPAKSDPLLKADICLLADKILRLNIDVKSGFFIAEDTPGNREALEFLHRLGFCANGKATKTLKGGGVP